MKIYKNSFVVIVARELQAKQHHQPRSAVLANLLQLQKGDRFSPTTGGQKP
jgi:hypothetical protein